MSGDHRPRRLVRIAFFAILAVFWALFLVETPETSGALRECFGSEPTIRAVDGKETVGTRGADVIVGTRRGDVIRGRGGADKICAGWGDDVVFGGRGDDQINLGRGDDRAKGGPGDDLIRGTRGRDEIDGNGGRDTLVGGASSDELRGGKNADRLFGNTAADLLRGQSGRDMLDGGKGDDLCFGGSGTDIAENCETSTSAYDACVATPAPLDSYTVFGDRSTWGWVMGDLMKRVRLDARRSLWMFGDTFFGQVDAQGALKPGWAFARNSALLQERGCFTVVMGHDGGAWTPALRPAGWSWPQGALVVEERLFAFALELVKAADDAYPFNFEVVGGTMSVFDIDDLSAPLERFELPAIRGAPFGWGAFIDGGYAYLYAHEQEPLATYVARLPVAQLSRPKQWTFWNGEAWVPGVDRAASIAPHKLRVFQHGGGHRAVTVPLWDQRLHLFRSDSPTGPFELTDVVALDRVMPDVRCYAYQASVVAPLAGEPTTDELTIAVNFLPLSPEETLARVERYGPRLVTVTPSR